MGKGFPVDIRIIRNIIGFDYATYHPFVETLRQYQMHKKLRYEDSVLHRYYALFQPGNLSQVLSVTDEGGPLAQLGPCTVFWPWGEKPHAIGGEKGLPISAGTQYFGPVTLKKGRLEFDRLVKLYRSIKKKGYKPKSHVRGFYLKRGDDYRFLLIGGNHRVAVLAALGHTEVTAQFQPKHLKIIDVEDANNWPQVTNGVFDISTAEKVFNVFFDSGGEQKAGQIGLKGVDRMSLSYQGKHLQGTRQKYEIIMGVLGEDDKTLLDVGCNDGLLVKWFNDAGLAAEGVDYNPKYVREAEANGVSNIRVFKATPQSIDEIGEYDVITLLSVYHQWQVFGTLPALEMLKTLGNKAGRFIFQPPSVRRKYKYPPRIKDNDRTSIIDYNLGFLIKTFPGREVSYIGASILADKREPYRYLFMVK